MHTVLAMLSCRYERSQREDGRRCHKWFLVDHLGCEHLAVVGIETDTMDGHYTYQAVSVGLSQQQKYCAKVLRTASLQLQTPAHMHSSLLCIYTYVTWVLAPVCWQGLGAHVLQAWRRPAQTVLFV